MKKKKTTNGKRRIGDNTLAEWRKNTQHIFRHFIVQGRNNVTRKKRESQPIPKIFRFGNSLTLFDEEEVTMSCV